MSAIQAITYVIQNGDFNFEDGQRVLFLNADPDFDYDLFLQLDVTVQQVYKPAFDALVSKGQAPVCDWPADDERYDVVCLNVPQNMVEARYLMAYGLRALSHNGLFICAADNKAGGTRLKKTLDAFGVSDIHQDSRSKARCCWGRRIELNDERIEDALKEGAPQSIISEQYVSQAGVFGWNKIDKGSDILTRFIPVDMKGHGADFGCGYGFLSKYILQNCEKVKSLRCIDADYRAVALCEQNLQGADVPKEFLWADLNFPIKALRNLHFVVMNPPFHEGKKESVELGRNFIGAAHAALGRNGRLYMVANAHLPYERLLEEQFFSCKKLHEGQGFKVFEAVK